MNPSYPHFFATATPGAPGPYGWQRRLASGERQEGINRALAARGTYSPFGHAYFALLLRAADGSTSFAPRRNS